MGELARVPLIDAIAGWAKADDGDESDGLPGFAYVDEVCCEVKDVDCEGVEVPLGPLTEGCRLRLPVPVLAPAAAARAAEACDCPIVGSRWGVAVLLAVPVLVEGVVMLRPDTEEDDRCRRDGVGWVGPVIWWFGFGSAGSIRAVLVALE